MNMSQGHTCTDGAKVTSSEALLTFLVMPHAVDLLLLTSTALRASRYYVRIGGRGGS